MGKEKGEAHKEKARGIKDKNPGRLERRMSEDVGSDQFSVTLRGHVDVPSRGTRMYPPTSGRTWGG